VHRHTIRRLGDLFAAAESVRHDQHIGATIPHLREQTPFADCLGDVVVFALEAK
jgi:hypothetical protein